MLKISNDSILKGKGKKKLGERKSLKKRWEKWRHEESFKVGNQTQDFYN